MDDDLDFLGSSEQLNKLFSHLYIKERLARFVIDEAHCISDWGILPLRQFDTLAFFVLQVTTFVLIT